MQNYIYKVNNDDKDNDNDDDNDDNKDLLIMKLPEYDALDAIGLAQLIAQKQISPKEALEAAIERIEVRNPKLNAVVEKHFDLAFSQLDLLPKGPLYGVPFLLKDLKAMMKNTITTNSSKLTQQRVATEQSLLVSRYQKAGLQIIGKTNTPEFGIMGITEPSIRGACRNPWNLDHTPGGSSGGAASAVSARMVLAAHGGDGGGSIRIPASACGLFGLKPSRGRVTMAPFAGEAWGGFVQEHALCLSVRDSALLLDIASEWTSGEPYYAPYQAEKYIDVIDQPLGKKLKVAYCKEALYAGENHPSCIKALEDAVQLMIDLGHEVVEAKPEFSKEDMVRAYFLTVASGTAKFVQETSMYAGKKPCASDYEPTTWLLAQIGWKCSAPELLKYQSIMHKTGRQVASFFEKYDLFMTPTLAQLPAKVGELLPKPSELFQLSVIKHLNLSVLLDRALEMMGKRALSRTPNTQLFNQCGQPAMSVPLYWTEDQIPVGVQFASGFGNEALLLQVAKSLEDARPWIKKQPQLID
jgi:amidase